jgi:hypothetical protein
MTVTWQSILDDAALAAQKVRTVLSVVNGSAITKEIEAIVPGIAGLVATTGPIGATADAITAADALVNELVKLGARPMDANEMARIHHDLEEP